MASQVKKTTRSRADGELLTPIEEPLEVIARRTGPLAEQMEDSPLGLLSEFEAMFEFAPVAMVLVNRRRQVIRVNRAARRFSIPERTDWMDMPQGLFISCPNRNDVTKGCGYGPHCTGCTVRRLIDQSFETRREASPVEALAPYAVEGRVEERWLRISTSHMIVSDGERTLLCIEDITERRLPPGARTGELPSGE